MNILVTGAKGFVGRNLCAQLRNIRDGKAKNYALETDLAIFEYDIDSTAEELDEFCRKADFVFNLAGVNRPQNWGPRLHLRIMTSYSLHIVTYLN